jgi:hypothetical protein
VCAPSRVPRPTAGCRGDVRRSRVPIRNRPICPSIGEVRHALGDNRMNDDGGVAVCMAESRRRWLDETDRG